MTTITLFYSDKENCKLKEVVIGPLKNAKASKQQKKPYLFDVYVRYNCTYTFTIFAQSLKLSFVLRQNYSFDKIRRVRDVPAHKNFS